VDLGYTEDEEENSRLPENEEGELWMLISKKVLEEEEQIE
jgi:hypothetical protein